MASLAPSCKTPSSSSSPTVTANARDRAASCCSNNNSGDRSKESTTSTTTGSEDDSHSTPYSPAPVVRSHHQLIQSPYSSQSRRHHNHHHTYHSHSYSHNRHYHLNGDSFDDSSSSLSSTPSSGCTTATATSSTSSTVSDCAIDCITGDPLTMQLADHHHHQQQNSSSTSRNTSKNSSSTGYLSHSRGGQRGSHSCKGTSLEQALNDLNSSPSTTGSVKSTSRKSSSGSSKKNSSQQLMMSVGGGGGGSEGSNKNGPGRRSSTPPALSNTENWSHFHFGGGAGDNSSESNESRHEFTHHNSSPRASSELYSMVATLDQRLKTATLNSSSSPKMSSSGKAVAVIKGTSSVSRLSSSSFNNGSLSGGSNCTASSQDWKKHLHSHEIRKLKRELDQSNEKVATLTSQLATHSHMVTAFEQSLASMSLRLQQLTNLSTQKDCEIARLKAKVEELRQCNRSESNFNNSLSPGTPKKCKDKKESKNKSSNNCSKQLSEKERKSLLIRRHTFVSPVVNDLDQKDIPATGHSKEGKWFKAFRRSSSSNKKHSTHGGSTSDQESEEHSSASVPKSTPFGPFAHRVSSVESFQQIETTHDPDALLIHELKKQLREKEKTITDLRLEALTTAHQLQSLEELVGQLKSEIASYKAENEKLNKLSAGSSGSSMTSIRLSSQNSPLKPNEPSIGASDWQNSDEASGYASINSLYFNPYDTC